MKIQVVNALTSVKERGANEEGARGAAPRWCLCSETDLRSSEQV